MKNWGGCALFQFQYIYETEVVFATSKPGIIQQPLSMLSLGWGDTEEGNKLAAQKSRSDCANSHLLSALLSGYTGCLIGQDTPNLA